jgi:hypothetical protein
MDESSKTAIEVQTTEEGNFILYVSDQSAVITPVDIQVHIDNHLAVDDTFVAEDFHNWIEYRFQLEQGRHTITAISKKGNAVLEEDFEVVGTHWAVIDFWSDPKKHFSFDIKDEPIYFD